MSGQEGASVAACERLSDSDLVREVKYLAEHSRRNELHLLAHLAEFDSRRLCLEEGHRSLYEYCTVALGFEDGEAYRRIRVARVIRAYPEALAALTAKKVTASSLVVLSPWLERSNVSEWLSIAAGKSRRELEALVAARYPQAPQPDAVRNFPFHPLVVTAAPPRALEAIEQTSPENSLAPTEASSDRETEGSAERLPQGWQQMVPVALDRVHVGFDAASVVANLIDRVRQILRHKYPEGRLEDLIREALEEYLDRKDPQRRLEMKAAKAECGAEAPAPEENGKLPTRFLRAWAAGRYIPAKVKSAVWARDDGRCAWRETDGTVCGSKDWIEYDHLRPFARGGRSDDPRNIRLLCRVHNQAAAEAEFGRRSEDPRRADSLGFSAGPASA